MDWRSNWPSPDAIWTWTDFKYWQHSTNAVSRHFSPEQDARSSATLITSTTGSDGLTADIRAKEKLIALLEEQKQAIIHQAVAGRIDLRTRRAISSLQALGRRVAGRCADALGYCSN